MEKSIEVSSKELAFLLSRKMCDWGHLSDCTFIVVNNKRFGEIFSILEDSIGISQIASRDSWMHGTSYRIATRAAEYLDSMPPCYIGLSVSEKEIGFMLRVSEIVIVRENSNYLFLNEYWDRNRLKIRYL